MLIGLLAFLFIGNAFVAAPRQSDSLRGAQMITAGAAAGALPQVAMAMDNLDMDSSSLNLAAPLETVMLGIVLGTVPITVFGLLVSAWLQFKKGPTLGI